MFLICIRHVNHSSKEIISSSRYYSMTFTPSRRQAAWRDRGLRHHRNHRAAARASRRSRGGSSGSEHHATLRQPITSTEIHRA